jgi:hypothetical protein
MTISGFLEPMLLAHRRLFRLVMALRNRPEAFS